MGRSAVFNWVIVFAFVLRAVIPAGFMLAPSEASGAIQVVICIGSQFETVWIDEDGNIIDETDDTDHSDNLACLYTSLNLLADVSAPPATTIIMQPRQACTTQFTQQCSPNSLATKNTARAPPLLS